MELVESTTGLFKPAEEMRRLLDAKGLTPDKEIVSYCQGGGRAAHGVLALNSSATNAPGTLMAPMERMRPRRAPVER